MTEEQEQNWKNFLVLIAIIGLCEVLALIAQNTAYEKGYSKGHYEECKNILDVVRDALRQYESFGLDGENDESGAR